jgi:N6-adenosine-specific RNA methylase IME4
MTIFRPLPDKKYDIIVADPPWLVKTYSEKGESKSPQAHYRCHDIEAISTLPVWQIARGDCWLFLWTSAPLLNRAFDVMRAWRFSYCTRFSWRKMTAAGKPRKGPGFVVRTHHEDILIGKRGAPLYAGALDSLLDGVAREHSRKPEEFYDQIESFLPRAWRIDLFSRLDRPGWDSWGDEAGKFNEADPAPERGSDDEG